MKTRIIITTALCSLVGLTPLREEETVQAAMDLTRAPQPDALMEKYGVK